MKRITHIIAAAMAVLMLASCSSGKIIYGESPKKSASTGRTTWTVLVYMCGGEDETNYGTASKRLDMLMDVDYPENISVVVQTGGSSQWHKKGIYRDYIQRFEMGRGEMSLADQKLSTDMGDYSTLESFLKWGTTQYKSDNYILVLSGQGSGSMHGMAFDEQNDDDSLSIEEISYAVNLTGKHFNIIGFDAPLMSTLEAASTLSTAADYMVASQEILSGNGWDYSGFLKYLSENPTANGDEIGKAICDTYFNSCEKNGSAADATMAVIDLSKASALAQAFDGMAGDMLTATDSLQGYADLVNAMSNVLPYGGMTVDEGFSNLIDVGDLAARIHENVGSTSDALTVAMNDAVVYRVCGERKRRSTGISVYYPFNADNDELQQYMDISSSKKYKEFLRKICVNCSVTDYSGSEDYTSSWAWCDYNNDMQSLEYKTILNSDAYELNMLGNMSMFKDIGINVYKLRKKDGQYVYLGKYEGLSGDREAGIFEDNFDGKVFKLCSRDAAARLVYRNESYELYSVPVIMDGKNRYVRVVHSLDKDKYEIIGVWDGVNASNGKVGTFMDKVGIFDKITPVLPLYDELHENVSYIPGSFGMKLFGATGRKKAGRGEYIFEYELSDIYGVNRHGTPVNVRISGGKAHFE